MTTNTHLNLLPKIKRPIVTCSSHQHKRNLPFQKMMRKRKKFLFPNKKLHNSTNLNNRIRLLRLTLLHHLQLLKRLYHLKLRKPCGQMTMKKRKNLLLFKRSLKLFSHHPNRVNLSPRKDYSMMMTMKTRMKALNLNQKFNQYNRKLSHLLKFSNLLQFTNNHLNISSSKIKIRLLRQIDLVLQIKPLFKVQLKTSLRT